MMSAPSPTSALPVPLRRALTRVAGKHLSTQLAVGFAWLLGAAVLLLGAQMLLDRVMDFPLSARVGFLVLDAGVLGTIAWRKIILPWRRRWREPDAALAIQRRWPALGSRVISAVQLGAAPSVRGGGSPLLVEALVKETTAHVSTRDLGQVVPHKSAARQAGAAALLLLIAAGIAAWQWPFASVLLRRVFLSDAPLPTATVVLSQTRDLQVPSGSAVALIARAGGELPLQGRIELHLEGGQQRTVLVRPEPDDPARFIFTFDNVQRSFSYRFHLGDGRGPVFKVTTLPAPLLEHAEFTQEFPAYTRRQPLRQPAGALSFFPGSKIRVVARANQAIGSAEIRFGGDNPPEPVPMVLDPASPLLLRAEFTVPASGISSLSIPLVSVDGMAAKDSTAYPVTMEIDRVPTVQIEEPLASAETIVPTARFVIRARVRDDFAVSRVELVTEILGGRTNRRRLTVSEDGLVTHTLEPISERPPLPEGTQLAWWIEAFDNNNVTGPGVGVSERRELGIVSFAQKQEEMLRRLEETSRRMEDVARRQGEVRDSLGEALRRTQDEPNPPPAP